MTDKCDMNLCTLFAGTFKQRKHLQFNTMCAPAPPVPCHCCGKGCIVLCSRTVRRLFWYVLSAMMCVWSVMMLKNVEIDSTRFLFLMVFSVSMPDAEHRSHSSWTQWSCISVHST